MADIVHSNKNNKENMVTSYMVFSLDRKGKLTNLYTAQSCGIKELDEMILYIFRQASSSFPPIPSYITLDPFEFCIVYNIQLKQDQPNFRFTMN